MTGIGILLAVTAHPGTANADPLCDQMRREHGPYWPCINVPTYTPLPTQFTAPPTATTGDNGTGPKVGAEPGPGPGAGNGTPIIPVPGYEAPGLPGQRPPAPPQQTRQRPAPPNTGQPAPPARTGRPTSPPRPRPSTPSAPHPTTPPAPAVVRGSPVPPNAGDSTPPDIPIWAWLLAGAVASTSFRRTPRVRSGAQTVSSDSSALGKMLVPPADAPEDKIPEVMKPLGPAEQTTPPQPKSPLGYMLAPNAGSPDDYVPSPQEIESDRQQFHDEEIVVTGQEGDPAVLAAKQRIYAREQGYAASLGTDEFGRRTSVYTNPRTGEQFSVSIGGQNDSDQQALDTLASLRAGAGPHADPNTSDKRARAALRDLGMIVTTQIDPVTGQMSTTITDPKTGTFRYIGSTPEGKVIDVGFVGNETPQSADKSPLLSDPRWKERGMILGYGGTFSGAAGETMLKSSDNALNRDMERESKYLKRMGRIGRFGGLAGTLGGATVDYYSGNRGFWDAAGAAGSGAAGSVIGGWAGAAAGTWAGAKLGAAVGGSVGSVIPGAGTAIGAGIGTLVGSFIGLGVYSLATS